MKKKSILMMILAFVFFPLFLVACDDVAVLKSISVKEGTLPTELIVGEKLDTSNTVVIATYSNDATKEVKAEDLEFSEIDTSTMGYKELIITYGSKTLKVQIKVVSSITDTYDIVGFEKPKFVQDYLENIKVQENKELEFMNRTDGYYVGDDNEFVFLPIITALDNNGNDITLNKYLSKSQVFVKENGTFTELVGGGMEEIVKVDNENSTFDFTQQAVGKTFKISVRPYYLTEKQESNVERYTQSFEFTVVDGWNVYDVQNLSRFDNNPGTAHVWAEYKQANNIGNENTNAIILHNDIIVTTNDIPSAYKWQEGEVGNTQIVGNLKNRKSIYTRAVAQNETFQFIGNYFTVDASKLPLISYDDDNDNNNGGDSHSMLFAFGGDNDGAPTGVSMGDGVLKNTNFIGNGQRSEDIKYSGAINLLQTSSDHCLIDNTISRKFFTNFLFVRQAAENIINNSRAYDSYSCMIYSHQCDNNIIRSSELKGAGGPLIILTHVDPNKNPTSKYSNLTVEDSNLEALVTGTEAWFVSHGAAELAGQIKAMNRLFTETSAYFKANGIISNTKSFINGDGKINMIGLIMASDDITNKSPIMGQLDIVKNNKKVGYLNTQDETLNAWLTAIGTATGNKETGYKLPYFATPTGGFSTLATNAAGEPTGLAKLVESQNPFASLDASDANMFNGDYLSAYIDGGLMGLMVQYFNLD